MRVWQQLRRKFIDELLRVYALLPLGLRRRTWRVFFYIIILACLEVLSILSISFLALSVAAPEKLAEFSFMPLLFRLFPGMADLSADPRQFALVASSAVVALIIVKNGMSVFVGLAASRLGEGISLFAGETLFRSYLYSPYIKHLGGGGNAMFKALSWRGQLGAMVINIMMVYTYAAISLALFLTMFTATPEVLLLIIGGVALLAASLYKSMKSAIDKAGADSAEFSGKEAGATLNAMNGIREVLIYRQQPVFFKTFHDACQGGVASRAFLTIAPPIPVWVLEAVGFLVIPVTLGAMLWLYDASMARMTGILTMIMLVSWRVLPLFSRSLSCLVTMRGIRYPALACLEKIEEVLRNPGETQVEPAPGFALRRNIVFDHVCFRYPSGAGDCLHDLCFSLERGSRIGVIGRSGAGKSSIAAILSGLVRPTSGELLVDGRPLSPAELAAYSLRVGYVPQTPYIMPGTLAENVAFSQWGKPWDEERVLKACRFAALDIVDTHPMGVRLPIGERGTGLSGGQAQRLSIARALYANPSLLILDEATSALDSAIESAIMNTVYALPENITTVIIAHRLSTVEHCGQLLWIEGGKIVDSGPPEAVLPRYREYLNEDVFTPNEKR
ncbi:MAG: ABC transporter ATP-binding protein/permease [Desulfarculales bacterium]|jgi:ABC-type multidrug transport system fused ATPase/permease subunit|nr:ABC transporter ATP-binding protein/permease [Desulfarculales bacterium]